MKASFLSALGEHLRPVQVLSLLRVYGTYGYEPEDNTTERADDIQSHLHLPAVEEYDKIDIV